MALNGSIDPCYTVKCEKVTERQIRRLFAFTLLFYKWPPFRAALDFN